MRQLISFFLAITAVCALAACAPKVGSEAWCKNMQEKASGDWTINEAADFAKHCILRNDP
jgi:hypothetical protein